MYKILLCFTLFYMHITSPMINQDLYDNDDDIHQFNRSREIIQQFRNAILNDNKTQLEQLLNQLDLHFCAYEDLLISIAKNYPNITSVLLNNKSQLNLDLVCLTGALYLAQQLQNLTMIELILKHKKELCNNNDIKKN